VKAMRSVSSLVAVSLLAAIAHGPLTRPAAAQSASDPAVQTKIVAEATAGRLTALTGKVHDPDCGVDVDYQADVVDLNGDGQAEVFTQLQSGCYGMAGVQLDLLIKAKDGAWKPQFGFPGMYTILETKNLGFPDIEIGGPGACFPVWRWNGASYAIHKRCDP